MTALSVTSAGLNFAHGALNPFGAPTTVWRVVRFSPPQKKVGKHGALLYTRCLCCHSSSPEVHSDSGISLLNFYLDSGMRISSRSLGRRGLSGRGLSRRICRKRSTKCMIKTEASTDVLPTISLLEDEDSSEEAIPPLSNKPVFHRPRPPVREVSNDPLKLSGRPALKLKLKGQGPSAQEDSPAQGANGSRGSRLTLRTKEEIEAERKIGRSAERSPFNGSNARSSFKDAHTPGESVAEASAEETVASLGHILKKVEDMDKASPRKAAASPQSEAGRKPTFTPSRSRSVAPLKPPQRQNSTQWRPSDPTSGGPTAAQMEVGKREAPVRDDVQSFRPDASFRAQPRQPLTTRPKPVPANADAAIARKGPILRDIGAAPRRPAPPPSGPSAAGPTTPAAAKFTRNAPVKGKEDWRKKLVPSVSDGARRRIEARQKDDATDPDSPVVGKGLARGRGRKQTKASRKAMKAQAARAAAPVRVEILEIGKEGMSVADLADKLAVNDSEVVKALFMKGIATTVNQTLDEETVRVVCQEFEVEVVEAGTVRVEDLAKKTTEFLDEEDLEYLEVRPPVVTIMGHVDHGKTSLLDHIRKSKVAAGEAGGITQGIGAYRVLAQVGDEQQDCVFLDTPGHEAFSAMRARGARVTDIAVIVVAADDGVRPQTLEAIAHAKAAGVPFVVAINKMDKEGAQPERVMQELSSHNVMVEDWGGDVPAVQVSAKAGTGVDLLLETIMLIAELQELRANPNRSAKGTVIEARLDKSRGTVATLLIQNGTLHKGDVVLCGESYGKVRAMTDDTGANVAEAGPCTAVQVTGLSNVPVAGDEFEIMDSIDIARERASDRAVALRERRLVAQAGEGKVTLSSLGNAVAADSSGSERHQLNIVLKVDVQGSVEAIREALLVLPQNTVGLRFLMQAAGEVSASDIDLAIASEAIVIAFNVGVQPSIQAMADRQGVEIRTYSVIYDLLDDMRKAMEGLLDIVEEEIPLGQAEVRAVFGNGSARVAGCMVNEGKLVKGCALKVMRGNSTVHTGLLDSLKRVKEVAKEVVAGLECGVGVADFSEWQEGDVIEAFTKVEKRRSLEEASVTFVGATAGVRASS